MIPVIPNVIPVIPVVFVTWKSCLMMEFQKESIFLSLYKKCISSEIFKQNLTKKRLKIFIFFLKLWVYTFFNKIEKLDNTDLLMLCYTPQHALSRSPFKVTVASAPLSFVPLVTTIFSKLYHPTIYVDQPFVSRI